MRHDPHRRPHRGRGGGDPERSLVFAVRCALLPTLSLPAALAALAASSSHTGPALALALPLAAAAILINLVCWRRVIVRWRALPRRDDDDNDWWRRWWDAEGPLDPTGDPGGIKFDWESFERDFRAHVNELERLRGRELLTA